MKPKFAIIFAGVLLLLLWGGSSSWAREKGSVLYAARVYNAKLTPKDASWIASRCDLLIVTGSGDKLVGLMREKNPDIKIFRFLTTAGVPCSWHLLKDHPKWFLRDPEGNIIRRTYACLVDPAIEEWSQAWVDFANAKIDSFGYDGAKGDMAFVDISSAVPEILRTYPSDEAWHQVEEKHLRRLHRGLNRKGHLLILNNVHMYSRTNEDFLLEVRIHNEDGFIQQAVGMRYKMKPNDRFASAQHFVRGMSIIKQCSRMGKIVILAMQPSFPHHPRKRVRDEISYCVGLYLLVREDNVYLNIDWDGDYGRMQTLFRVYGEVIEGDYGEPTGETYKEGGLWKRGYSKGLVVVNPGKHTFDFISGTNH